jgi:phage repressor protein C with HTH and peptisase S24 domain
MYHISKNLSTIRHSMGLTQVEFAEIFDIKDRKGVPSNDKVWTYENGKANPSITLIERVSHVTGVPYEELVTEEISEQRIDKKKFKEYIDGKKNYEEIQQIKSFTDQRREQKVENKPFMVPLVPVKAQAGYVKSFDQSTYIDNLEQYALPPGVNPHGAVWRYWEVEGESMEPAFHSGDIILTSLVHQMDWENLRNFYLYVIVTEEKVLFKRVFSKNNLEWVLISENEEHSPQQLLPVEFIKEVWVFRRSIVSKAPPTKVFEIKV